MHSSALVTVSFRSVWSELPSSTPTDSDPWSMQLEVLNTVQPKSHKKCNRPRKKQKSTGQHESPSSRTGDNRTKQKYTKPPPKIMACAIATVLKPGPILDPVAETEFSFDSNMLALSRQYFSLDTYC